MTKNFIKTGKRIFALMLSVIMVITAMPMSVFSVDEGEYIEVRTVEDLYNVRLDLTANYVLMNDIDLTEATAEGGEWDFYGNGWNPIGSGDIYSNNAFSGTFDGNGHKIIGLRIDITSLPSGTGDVYAGLFSNVTGTVKNLTISGSISVNDTLIESILCTGSFAGYCNGIIYNCHNETTISTIQQNYSSYTGGIVGFLNEGQVKNSTNKAILQGKGSLIDYTNSRYVAVGGIVGFSRNASVENCYNTNTLTAVCGNYSSEMWPNYNGADYFYKNAYSGGIIGYSESTSITDCYNNANILSTYDNSKNYGKTSASGISNGNTTTIKNCYNIGTITITSSGSKHAIGSGTIENSYYLAASGTGSTGATSLTEAQALLQSMYVGFDFENVWEQNTSSVYPYPQLTSNLQDIRIISEAIIYSLPTNLTYTRGDELNISGMVLKFTYENADTEYISVTNDMVNGYDSYIIGTQILTVIYNSVTFEFEVTVNDKPFKEIYTVQDLYNIRYDLEGNYILMNDIDLTEATANGGEWSYGTRGWNPIGSNDVYSSQEFKGVFNGNGYSIIGMRIDFSYNTRPAGISGDTWTGLFANNAGTIQNLHMKNVDLINSYGSSSVGGAIAGKNSGTIIGCSVSGTIKVSENYGGGLVGINTGLIEFCYNTANVTAKKDTGGIVGRNERGTIRNCYNLGEIYTSASSNYAGGIVGYSYYGTASYCYNMGTVKAYSSSYAYALCSNDTTNCYFLYGSGKSTTGSIALTEAQMKLIESFVGFDFNSIWTLNPNAIYSYPQLKINAQDIRSISSASIYSLPEKLIYIKGEQFDATGMVLEFKYENADTEYITVTSDMVRGYSSTLIATQKLSVTYHSRTFEFEVTVNEKPFKKIYTVQDLYNIRYDLEGNYILMNDIDLTEATAKGGEWDYGGRGWNPIGSNDIYSNVPFTGIFDGNGYSIVGMRIQFNSSNMPSGIGDNTWCGLFANNNGIIQNLHIEKVQIISTYAKSHSFGGAIAGENSGTIINCSVLGTVNTSSYDYSRGGGIVGLNKGFVEFCYNSSNVTSGNAGGIAGRSESGTVKNCYNTGIINGAQSKANSGGIVGFNTGTITLCYNIGTVYSISSGYANGIAYMSSGTLTNSYYLDNTGNGSSGAIALTEAQLRLYELFVGFDFDNTWIINSYANYPYPQLKSNVQDLNENVSLIRIIAYPEKIDYLTGDELNTLGGMLEVVYISGKIDLLTLTADMISGFDTNSVGEQTLTVTFGGQTDTFDVNVERRPKATSVIILTEPNQKEFIVGTEFDFTGATIEVEYDDGSTKVLDVTSQMTSGTNINHIGTQTVTVTIDDQYDNFEIKVVPASISHISIASLPSKLIYIESEKLDITGLTIVANYTNGTKVTVASGFSVSGYDANKIGEQIVTIDFVGKTTSFVLIVNERTVTGLEIASKPNKLNYVVGEELDLTGMVVLASYETNVVEIVTDYEINSLDGTAGTKVITVYYRGRSASFTVNVSVLSVEKLTISNLPTKLSYIENEPLSTEGLVVTATYNNGTVVEVTDYKIIGFSPTPGTHTIYVSFEGQVASFSVTVAKKELSDLRIVLPEKTTYNIGDSFDETGMKVIACYNNGQEHIIDNYTMTGFDSSTSGAKEIIVSFGGITRSFIVAIAEKIPVFTNGKIEIDNVETRRGETVAVPVSVTKNPGLAGFRHVITFDANSFEFTEIILSERFAAGQLIVNDEKADEGEITVVWFGTEDVKVDGELYSLSLIVKESATFGKSEVTISFEDFDNTNISGDNLVFIPANGKIDILSYWLGDLTGDRRYKMADLLMLAKYVAGISMNLNSNQLLAADVNEDGAVDIHDVVMLQQWILDAE